VSELLEKGKEIVKSSKDAKYVNKVTIVNMVLSGSNITDVASSSGVSKRTISGWISKVDKNGFESLKPKKQPGRPPKLTAEMKSEIASAIEKDPMSFGYQIWDGPSLSDYIHRTYGIEYTVRSCQYLFHNLGYNLIRPQTYPSLDEPNEETRDDFKKRSQN